MAQGQHSVTLEEVNHDPFSDSGTATATLPQPEKHSYTLEEVDYDPFSKDAPTTDPESQPLKVKSYSLEEVNYDPFNQEKPQAPQESSAIGAAARSALMNIVPGIAGFMGGGVGAIAGSRGGPVVSAGLGLAGGLMAAHEAAQAQDYILKQVIPEEDYNDWKIQLASDQEQHPASTTIGGFLGQLGLAKPSISNLKNAAKAVANFTKSPDAFRALIKAGDKTAIDEFQALVNVGVGTGTQGGLEAYRQIEEGEFDPATGLLALAGGALISDTTRLGKRVTFEPVLQARIQRIAQAKQSAETAQRQAAEAEAFEKVSSPEMAAYTAEQAQESTKKARDFAVQAEVLGDLPKMTDEELNTLYNNIPEDQKDLRQTVAEHIQQRQAPDVQSQTDDPPRGTISQQNNENVQQVPQYEASEAKNVSEMSRSLYEELAQNPSPERTAQIESQLSQLRQRVSQEGQVNSEAVSGLRTPASPDASRGLPPTTEGEVAVPELPSKTSQTELTNETQASEINPDQARPPTPAEAQAETIQREGASTSEEVTQTIEETVISPEETAQINATKNFMREDFSGLSPDKKGAVDLLFKEAELPPLFETEITPEATTLARSPEGQKLFEDVINRTQGQYEATKPAEGISENPQARLPEESQARTGIPESGQESKQATQSSERPSPIKRTPQSDNERLTATPEGRGPASKIVVEPESTGASKTSISSPEVLSLNERTFSEPARQVLSQSTRNLLAQEGEQGGRIPVAPEPGGTPEKLKDIVASFGKALRTPLKQGTRMRQKGTYEPGTGMSKIRYEGDLDTTAHEMAHRIDDTYGLTAESLEPTMEQQLSSFSRFGSEPPASYGATAKQRYTRYEGLAEFLRSYMVNPKEAARQAPELTKYVESKISAQDLKAINDFGTKIRQWAGLDPVDQVNTNIRTTLDQPSIYKRLVNFFRKDGYKFEEPWWGGLDTRWLDDMSPLIRGNRAAKQMRGITDQLPEDNFEVLVRTFSGSKGKNEQMLKSGLVDARGRFIIDGVTGEKLPFDWVLDIPKEEAATMTQQQIRDTINRRKALMVSERTIDMALKLDEKAKQFRADKAQVIQDIQDLYSTRIKRAPRDEKNALIQERDGKIEFQKRLIETNDRAVENKKRNSLTGIGGGIFGEVEQAQRALKQFEQNPELLIKDKEAARRYRLYAEQPLRYMQEKGRLSKKTVDDVVNSTEFYVSLKRVFDEAGYEGGGTKKLGAAKNILNKIKGSARQIENPYVSLLEMMSHAYMEADRNEVKQSFAKPLIGDRGMHEGEVNQLSSIGHRVSDDEPNSIPIFFDGEEQRWQFTKPIQDAMQRVSKVDPDMLLVLSGPMKWIRTLITLSPGFAVRNPIKDLGSRMIISRSSSPIKTLQEGVAVFLRDTSKEEARLALSGGTHFGNYGAGPKDWHKFMQSAVKEMSKDGKSVFYIPEKLAKGYAKGIASGEVKGRVAEFNTSYDKAKKMGYDDYNANLYAAYQARSILDYAVAGTLGRQVNRYMALFFNPAMQSLRRMGQAIGENPKQFAARFSLIFAPKALEYLWNKSTGNQEEYDQLPSYQKDMFINLKILDNRFLRIPLPYEYGVFASGFTRLLRYANGDKNAFVDYPTNFMNVVAPAGPDSMAGPYKSAVEAAVNYDLFRNAPFIPRYEENLALELRKGTSKASRFGQAVQALTQLFPRDFHTDARTIDHLIKGFGGGMGTLFLNATDIGKPGNKGDLINTVLGMTTPSPASNAADVQYVFDRAKQLNELNAPYAKRLKRALGEYASAQTDAEKDEKAKHVRQEAADIRKNLEQEPIKEAIKSKKKD